MSKIINLKIKYFESGTRSLLNLISKKKKRKNISLEQRGIIVQGFEEERVKMHCVIFFFLVLINGDSSEEISCRFSLIRNCRNLDQHNLYILHRHDEAQTFDIYICIYMCTAAYFVW